MITSIDTNVLVTLWAGDNQTSSDLQSALDDASEKGVLSIYGAVYSELMASPRVTEDFIIEFCSDAGILIDWSSNEMIWKSAGRAYEQYARQRRRQGSGQPRRILADFLIGAHAFINGHSLLTLDTGIYRTAFPKLAIQRV